MQDLPGKTNGVATPSGNNGLIKPAALLLMASTVRLTFPAKKTAVSGETESICAHVRRSQMGPAIFKLLADGPTAKNFPSRMATASAVLNFSSAVRILPL